MRDFRASIIQQKEIVKFQQSKIYIRKSVVSEPATYDIFTWEFNLVNFFFLLKTVNLDPIFVDLRD